MYTYVKTCNVKHTKRNPSCTDNSLNFYLAIDVLCKGLFNGSSEALRAEQCHPDEAYGRVVRRRRQKRLTLH